MSNVVRKYLVISSCLMTLGQLMQGLTRLSINTVNRISFKENPST